MKLGDKIDIIGKPGQMKTGEVVEILETTPEGWYLKVKLPSGEIVTTLTVKRPPREKSQLRFLNPIINY